MPLFHKCVEACFPDKNPVINGKRTSTRRAVAHAWLAALPEDSEARTTVLSDPQQPARELDAGGILEQSVGDLSEAFRLWSILEERRRQRGEIMDNTVTGTGKVPAWTRVVPGFLLILVCMAGEAGAQRPVATYEKKASWAETLAALRSQTVRRPGLFFPQRGFRFQGPNQYQAPLHPLASIWMQLERDFPLECDWMLQDLAACGYPQDLARPDRYPIRWFGPRADADLEKKLLLRVIEELGVQGEKAKTELEGLSQDGTASHTRPWLELYAAACQTRREDRLRTLSAKCPAFVFTKHFNMGGSHYAFTEGLSDAQSERHFESGSALCLLEITDGYRQTIDLEKKAEPQTFTFEAWRTSSLRLADLVPDDAPGWCALAEVEAWGRDLIAVAANLSTPAP